MLTIWYIFCAYGLVYMKHEINKNTNNHEPVIRKATFRFYEELNDYLPRQKQRTEFEQQFRGQPSVKNLIESIGIPHSEIDLILVNGVSVDFTYQMSGGEYISVYPVFESMDISPLIRLRAKPLRETKFVVDVNLGKLAGKLRLLGFDTLFRNNLEDNEIIEIARKEKRIILTRDKALLTNKQVTHGYWIRNDDPKKQLREVAGRLQLKNNFKPFTRCTLCNSSLRNISSVDVQNRLPEDTLKFYDTFWECKKCSQLYWRGSHYHPINKLIDDLKNGT